MPALITSTTNFPPKCLSCFFFPASLSFFLSFGVFSIQCKCNKEGSKLTCQPVCHTLENKNWELKEKTKSLLAHSLRPTCLNRAAIFFTSALSCASSLSFSPHCTSIISSCKRVKSISHIGSDCCHQSYCNNKLPPLLASNSFFSIQLLSKDSGNRQVSIAIQEKAKQNEEEEQNMLQEVAKF